MEDPMSSFNDNIIAEFRANGGKVGGPFEGMNLLLLTTTGRRTGASRTSPVAYSKDGSNYVIAGSKAGADTHPLWFHNLEAEPSATIEVGDGDAVRTMRAKATVLPSGPERDRLFAAHAKLMPGFSDYETKTTRIIPIVVLAPVAE
jgi:deazaflavin-dependent oxidoreductase (nitroreductase family)